ncbi:hypothetical protein VTN49DRAFT_3626 [Thermomyces lanuginosus]|uniref:uncharacterized protein n=1 Tax=Thermomyces lanuginosus TaxID=5541 RepID=UPI0037438D57
MAKSQDVPLDEVLWRSPQHVEMMGGFLHSNNILFYFAESPFFDATSNNASLAIQASYNEAFRHYIETREAFEGRLKTMQGLEFVVAYDPLQAAAQSETQFAHPPGNIWVIRKQLRHKRPGLEDDIVVLSTYYVVGDAIYMAPSISKIVGNRVLTSVTSLTKLLNTASPLPVFTPSHGHTYLPPEPKAQDTVQAATQSQPSKQSSPAPGSQAQQKASVEDTGSQSTDAVTDTRNLIEAFGLLSRYGDEYMDENPLVGEPGSFILSKTNEPAPASRPPPKPGFQPPGRMATPATDAPTPANRSIRGADSDAETKERVKQRRIA